MAEPSPFKQTQGIADLLETQGVYAPTALKRDDILKQREMIRGLPGLGPVDYDAQLDKSREDAKLQFYLQMAQRGFAAAGAAPRRGESTVSTLSRELFSPLAGDASKLAAQFTKQKQAQRIAKRADEARLSQAALTMGQQQLSKKDAGDDKRFALAQSLAKKDYKPTKGLQRTVNGKTTDFVGFYYVNKLTNLPVYATFNAKGEEEQVPQGQLSEYRKPEKVTGLKATGAQREPRVVLIPQPDGKGGSVLVKRDVMQAVQIIPDTRTGPRTQYSPELFWKGTDQPFLAKQNGQVVNPISGTHYFPTDVANYGKPKTQRLYVKQNLTPDQVIRAKSIFGKNIEMGEGVNQHTLVHETDATRSLSMFDVKGRTVNITQAQGDEFLTTTKPDPKELFPTGGKPLGGGSPKSLTVTDKDPETGAEIQRSIQVIPWLTAPGVVQWKEVGKDGAFLDAALQRKAWETLPEDTLYKSLRPVLNDSFRSAVRLRTDLQTDVSEKLSKQFLTQGDLKRLAPLASQDSKKYNDALNGIINNRIRGITGKTPSEEAVVPASVIQLDPRVKAMSTVPKGSSDITRSVVNPAIFQPWTRKNTSIQLGTGSHPGFSQRVSSEDVLESRRNFPAIKKEFNQIYSGARNLGDAEERVLLFSGLWKKLPGVAKKQKSITLSDEQFRNAFEAATVQYNKAATEFKPAAAINIGKGAQAKNLQSALDDDTDALRDNMIMLRFAEEQGGAWFTDGTWLSEMRDTGLGELVESWSGTEKDGIERDMPSNKWADIAKPDDQLSGNDLNLKKRVFAFLKEKSKSQDGIGEKISLTEFEKAAEYLGALSRYKIRAFSMIQDSRPSDNDIKILLAAFVGNRDSNTTTFAKLHELQNFHVKGLSRRINQGITLNAVFTPVFLANMDHTSRALQRSAVRDVRGKRAEESAALFRRSSEIIRSAVEAASGRIIPGNRSGAISPMSVNVDEASTANLYRRVLSVAKEAFPDKTNQEAVTEFVRQGLHLKRFLGVYGTSRRTAPPAVVEPDGSYTLN